MNSITEKHDYYHEIVLVSLRSLSTKDFFSATEYKQYGQGNTVTYCCIIIRNVLYI